jgi:hypothetical protein
MRTSWVLTGMLGVPIVILGALAWGHPLGASTGFLALLAPVSPVARRILLGPHEESD